MEAGDYLGSHISVHTKLPHTVLEFTGPKLDFDIILFNFI